MSSSAEPVHLNNHHRDTLLQIFQHPTSHNIQWQAVVSDFTEDVWFVSFDRSNHGHAGRAVVRWLMTVASSRLIDHARAIGSFDRRWRRVHLEWHAALTERRRVRTALVVDPTRGSESGVG